MYSYFNWKSIFGIKYSIELTPTVEISRIFFLTLRPRYDAVRFGFVTEK